MKLDPVSIEKPWGRTELPRPFPATGGRRIGEIWFAPPEACPQALLVKYIFTSEILSIQVHPNDEEARARGLPNGKSECWLILDAEPGAVIGIGLKQAVDGDALRAAALDGSIEALMDWKEVRVGDFFSIPAGTVHAIGAGVSLLEVQQNSDTTYRLYDYGRPRELHLDDGVAVSRAAPYPDDLADRLSGANQLLVEGPLFSLLHVTAPGPELERVEARERWVIPLAGTVEAGGEQARAGECLFVSAGTPIMLGADTRVVVAAAGA